MMMIQDYFNRYPDFDPHRLANAYTRMRFRRDLGIDWDDQVKLMLASAAAELSMLQDLSLILSMDNRACERFKGITRIPTRDEVGVFWKVFTEVEDDPVLSSFEPDEARRLILEGMYVTLSSEKKSSKNPKKKCKRG